MCKKFWCSAVVIFSIMWKQQGFLDSFSSSVLHTLDSFQLLHFVIKITELVCLFCTDVLRSIAEYIIKSSLVISILY